MALVTTTELFQKALEGKYAIGAFNVNNMEITQAIVNGAAKAKAPLILQLSKGAREYADTRYLMKIIEAGIEAHPEVPIAIHQDHGPDFETCKSAIEAGFTSVMIDASHETFEENIRITKEVVDYAHSKGVVVEAELGQLIGEQFDEGEGGGMSEGIYTDPDKAKEFVERTGCDSLAVAIGTSHGAYKFKHEPKLDFERLKAIHEKLPGFPLVLHGASSVLQQYVDLINETGGKMPDARGVPEDMLSEARQWGVTKVNIDTDLRLAMTAVIRNVLLKQPEQFDPRKYLGPARDELEKLVIHKMEVLGCAGKA
ncbi:MAG: class II fructose-1,6-bisphosphate aldolase [Candidatus Altimarinota bacterium]